MNYDMIILAAGKGTRMKSNLPKVLHEVGGKPMLAHLLDQAKNLDCKQPIVIYGHQGLHLRNTIIEMGYHNIRWVEQKEQLGTGHAVLQAADHLDDDTIYFILVGDAPLIQKETLISLGKAAESTQIAVLTVNVKNPFGYGRIIRDSQNQIISIIEEKEASCQERLIQEINSGILAIQGRLLKGLLPKITNHNLQKEYYLTDIVPLAVKYKIAVNSFTISDETEVTGCNDKIQLAQLERYYQKRNAEKLLKQGVMLADPNRIDIRGQLDVGQDSFIDINNVFEGSTTIGDNVHIEANCIIKNSKIKNNVLIKANSYIEDAIIENQVEVGPFARIRPKTQLKENSKIGNFVEIKNTIVETGSKISHLSYIGDSNVGKQVNIGAGAITCNYDGVNKYKTIIGDHSFIGSNTSLVAPLQIHPFVTVAAGSVITKDVPKSNLSFARSKQVNKDNWKRPTKK